MADALTPVLTDPRIAYIARWGGNCRDCADENGVCPNSGLPCGGADKAIRHVLSALDYGRKHGYLPAAQAPARPDREAMQQALDALRGMIDYFAPNGWGDAVPDIANARAALEKSLAP